MTVDIASLSNWSTIATNLGFSTAHTDAQDFNAALAAGYSQKQAGYILANFLRANAGQIATADADYPEVASADAALGNIYQSAGVPLMGPVSGNLY